MILSIIFILIASMCYGVISLIMHDKLKWSNDSEGFWGGESWIRKYKGTILQPGKDNWYYKFFKIKYEERFPLSATIFVWITDGFHLVQFIMIKALVLAILCYNGPVNVWMFLVIWMLWVTGFQLTYLRLQRKYL